MPQLERPSKADQVFPVFNDQLGVDRALSDCIEGAVVCRFVSAPQPCPADICQARAKLIPQKPEQAEYGIRIGGGIGHDLGRIEFGFLFQQQGKNGQAVTQSAGNNHSPQPGVLIREHVVPGDAPALSEVFGVGSCVYGAFGSQKAKPIGGGGLSISPIRGDRQPRVGGDNLCIGCSECFRSHEVLVHPGQTALPQRGMIFTNERFKTNVAGLGHKNCTQAGFKTIHLAVTVAEMRERLCEPRAAHHFQKDIRDAALGHQAMHLAAQCDQAVGFIHAIQLRDYNLAFDPDCLELQVGILVRPRGDTGKGCIQHISQTLHFGRPVKRAVQCAAHDALGILPLSPFQHADAGISISDAGGCKDVSSFYRFMPSVNGCKHIGSGVRRVPLRIQDVGLPGFGDHASRRILHGGFGPVGLIPQPSDSIRHVLAARTGRQIDPCCYIGKQFACPSPTSVQLIVGFGSRRLGQVLNGRHGAHDAVFWPLRVDGVPPCAKGQIVLKISLSAKLLSRRAAFSRSY